MSERPGYIGRIFGVLYKPREIMDSIEEGDLWGGVLIATLAAAFTAYSTMIYMGKIPLEVLAPQLKGVDIGSISGSMSAISGVASGVSVMVGWTFTGAVIHLLGRFLGGEGGYRRLFAMYGYASVPSLLNQVIRVVDASMMTSDELIGYYLLYAEMPSGLLKSLIGVNLLNIWSIAVIILTSISLQSNYGVGRFRGLIIALLPSLALFALGLLVG